jgi:hypothetical protein
VRSSAIRLLFCSKIPGNRITYFVTQDCLLFARRTPKFAVWAVLGEGCSSARDPSWDPGALIVYELNKFLLSEWAALSASFLPVSATAKARFATLPPAAASHGKPVPLK